MPNLNIEFLNTALYFATFNFLLGVFFAETANHILGHLRYLREWYTARDKNRLGNKLFNSEIKDFLDSGPSSHFTDLIRLLIGIIRIDFLTPRKMKQFNALLNQLEKR